MSTLRTAYCYEEFLHDPDPAVQVWHHHLDGLTVAQIRSWIDLTPTRMEAILKVAPPAAIAQDLRYQTGQRAVLLHQSGKDALLGPDGRPRVLVALLPRQITTAAYKAAVSAIEADLRDDTDGDVHLPREGVAGGVEMLEALRMIHHERSPAWEVDEAGTASLYRGRHAARLTRAEAAKIEPMLAAA